MFSMIIIDFNSIKMTMDYISNFSKWCKKYEECHFIIVDNYYSSETYNPELDMYGKVTLFNYVDGRNVYRINHDNCNVYYCSYGSNAGFAKGNNLGAKISRALFQDEYYLFSNNDITFSSFFPYEKYVRLMHEHNEIGVIGPRIKTPSGGEQSPCKKVSQFYMLFCQNWGYTIPFVKVKGDLDYDSRSKECYWISGCFMFIRAKAFDSVNGFDSNTFLYAEEMILSERLLKKKYKCYFDNDFQIVHLGGGTTKNTNSALRILELRFNSICYYNKKYRGVSDYVISLAKCNYKICKFLMKIKGKLKTLFEK